MTNAKPGFPPRVRMQASMVFDEESLAASGIDPDSMVSFVSSDEHAALLSAAEAAKEEAVGEARAQAFEEAVAIMDKGPEWYDRYRELLAKVNEARAPRVEAGETQGGED